ncbi:lysophospholipid acyltransferase family protein [Pseudonocardia hispaniensis]|uniref:Lysophospholipid acyltransferase family protein n=1 Tax=Pseudonocardia hispaniensis TaxID=904933 RepID=A0ABW1J744_9PSEU
MTERAPASAAVVGAIHPGPSPATDRPGGAWMPYSPCGPACLPPGGPPRRLRIARRCCALTALLLVALPLVWLPRARLRGRTVAWLSRGVLRAAGVRLRIRGGRYAEPGEGALVVANHLSWIEVLALGAAQPVRMLAKREVRDWPVIGALAARTGTLFVDRAGLRGLPATAAAVAEALGAGEVVGVFPEGTTWCGGAAGPFRRAAFQAALEAGAPVRPVAITLRLRDGTPARAAAFIGEDTFLGALRRAMGLPGLVCELTVLPAIGPGAADRRELAAAAGAAIAAVTGVAHPVHPGPVSRPAATRHGPSPASSWTGCASGAHGVETSRGRRHGPRRNAGDGGPRPHVQREVDVGA